MINEIFHIFLSIFITPNTRKKFLLLSNIILKLSDQELLIFPISF